MSALPRPAEAHRRRPPDRRQRDELLARPRPASRRSSASTTRARSSTNSATRCTASSPTSPIRSIAGTNVARDFVELPSQLYEHWLEQPEILRRFALHCRDRRADARGAARQGCSRRAPSTRASPRSNTPPRRWSIWTCISCAGAGDVDVIAFERAGARQDRHAGGDRHAPPHAALRSTSSPATAMPPATTAISGRRCSTPTPSTPSRRPATSSIRRRRNGSATSSTPPAISATRRRPTRAFRGRAPDPTALLRKRGLDALAGVDDARRGSVVVGSARPRRAHARLSEGSWPGRIQRTRERIPAG